MATITVTIDTDTIAEVDQMIRQWGADEVLHTINMSEGFTLAELFHALHAHDTAEHIIRQVWLGESDGDRDPLPWANGHGSRLSEEEFSARAADLAHNEGDERFYFRPRHGCFD